MNALFSNQTMPHLTGSFGADCAALPTMVERDLPGEMHDKAHPRLSVCHIASGDGWGGAEAQVATLVRALSKVSNADVSAIVLNEGRLAAELVSCGIDVAVLSERRHSFTHIIAEAQRFLRGRNTQIIHSHRYKENLIAALLALRNPGLRLVRTQHGWPEASSGLSGVKQWMAHALDRITARYATDTVISVSGELTNYLRPHVGPRKIVTIHNGIDLEQTRCVLTRAEAKRNLQLREDEFVVGFLGRLERVKRLDLFVAVAQEIAKRLPKVKFLIAGSGREEKQLRKLVREYGLETRILLLGHCQNSNEILRAMDLLLITSDHEGLPMAMLEAMALGTIVISRAVGGIPEVLTHNETGLMVENADPRALSEVCVRVLQDLSVQQRLSVAARDMVERRYSATCNGANVLNVYSSLVGLDQSLEPVAA